MKPLSFFKNPKAFFGGSSARSDRAASSSSVPEQNTTPGRSEISSQRSALQEELLARASGQKSKKEYFREWDAWAKGRDMPSDTKRKEAVKRMKKWFDQGKVEAVLNLRGLNLSCLP